MVGSNWQQLAGGSVNPYDVLRDDGTPTADYGQHVICDGGTVTLPSPKADEAVLVSNISQNTTVATSTGLVEQQSDVVHSSSASDPVLFVSDGSDWYVANNLDYLIEIPDGRVGNFDATQLNLPNGSDVDPWTDEIGDVGDLSQSDGGRTPSYDVDAINGNAAVGFADDFYDVDTATEITQPIYLFVVYNNDDNNSARFIHIHNDSGNDFRAEEQSDGSLYFGAGNGNITGGSVDSSNHVVVYGVESGSGFIRLDGAEVASGSIGTNSINGTYDVGNNGFDDYASGSFGQSEFFAPASPFPTREIKSEEQRLANKFDITF
jgi:hypothetical protein